jgi:hypothetical protein
VTVVAKTSRQLVQTSATSAEVVSERVKSAVLELATSLAGVIDTLPHTIRRAADLEKALGLQTPLAWRIFRLSQAGDAPEAVEYLPTVKQLERVLDKVAKTSPAPVVDRARAALSQFNSVVEEFGGDQRGFESLVSGLSPAGVRRVEIDHRRSAFRGNTHLWGLQCRCLIACAVERPGARPATRDGLAIRGLLDLQTMRPDLPLMVQTRMHFTALQGGPKSSAPSNLTEPPAWRSDLEIMPQFGGPRLPELYTQLTDDGWQQTMARVPGIGRAEAVSFYLRQVFRGAEEDDQPGLGMLAEIPAEWLHLEYLVPRGWTDPSTVRVRSYACRHDVKKAYEVRDSDRIPLHDQVQHFGGRKDVPASSEIPHWPDVVRQVLKDQGWWGESFDIYRCIVPFPMLHAWSGILVDRAAS